MHTTVITAADRCEARSVLRTAFSVVHTDAVIFAHVLSLQHFYWDIRAHTGFSIWTHDVALPFGWHDA